MSKEVRKNNSERMPKYRKILWLLIAILIVPFSLILTFGSDVYAIILASIILALVVFLMLSSKKYYNWTLPFIGVFFLGIFFKYNHWPGASLLITTSSLMVFFNLLFFSVKSFSVLKQNTFLKWFSFFTGIALALFMYTFMSKIQHWPLFIEFWILKHTINLMLIVIILVLIFKLPGLGFASWPVLYRKVFYRLILLPLVIIFTYSIILYVYPTVFEYLFNHGRELIPWGMTEVDLFNLEGIIL